MKIFRQHTTRKLNQRWMLSRKSANSYDSVCRHLELHLMERSYTGKSTKADCGMAGFDWCGIEENQELVVKFDIRQCRVKQFRLDASKIVRNYF